jgi:hypothetical protein
MKVREYFYLCAAITLFTTLLVGSIWKPFFLDTCRYAAANHRWDI